MYNSNAIRQPCVCLRYYFGNGILQLIEQGFQALHSNDLFMYIVIHILNIYMAAISLY